MPVYKTKGELRSSLLNKLGYGGLGAAAANFIPIADELLEEAQEQMFLLMPDDKIIKEWEWTTGANQRWYDFPVDCDVDRICEVAAFFEQTWLPMKKGIDSYHDSIFNYINYYPQRYDIRLREVTSALSNNLQANGDMAGNDTSAVGTQGWTWVASGWETSSGVATQQTYSSLFFSDLALCGVPVVGQQYSVIYTVGGAPLTSVSFAGETNDIDGAPLPIAVGTHTAAVEASSASTGLYFQGSASGVHTTLDNVSYYKVQTITNKEQLEVWPVDDTSTYTVKLEGFIKLNAFVADGDRATIDDRLILLYAEAHGKAHLNRPDAQLKMASLGKRLSMLRGQQHEGKRYIRRDETPDPLPRPIVVP